MARKFTIIMTTQIDNTNHGARPVRSLQAGAVPGPLPHEGPTPATGGPLRLPCGARGRRGNVTGQTSTSTKGKKQHLRIMHWNAEGVNSKRDSYSKKMELENILHRKEVSICCIQETHLSTAQTLKIRGYQCFRSDRSDRRKGGILTLVRNNIDACQTQVHMEGAEFQVLQIKTNTSEFSLVNFYCPNDRPLSLEAIKPTSKVLVCGDFNSHSQSWGYDHLDKRGEEVENWQDEFGLLLINQPYDTPTFYSRAWHTTSTPDIALNSPDLGWTITREVGEQLGGSDHRPVFLTVETELVNISSPLPRWNYKKANWSIFKHRTSVLTTSISTEGKDINSLVKEFNASILQAAKESIPRGARRNYKPYWTEGLEKQQKEVSDARNEAEKHPSQENHNRYQKEKAKLQGMKLEMKRKSWKEKTASLNLEKDGRKLWKLMNQLNDEKTNRNCKINLIENGKILTGKQVADNFARSYLKESDLEIKPEDERKLREEEEPRNETMPEVMETLITLRELEKAIAQLKPRKSPGPDGITNEMLKNLGPVAKQKLLEILNISWKAGNVPQVWREAIMIPIWKKGKDRFKATSYRPISLTSCVCKTMERIINLRLKWYLETQKIIVEQQAGFRQCHSTEDQVTYLSQDIEDAFQDKKSTLAMWIDLQKAFDKVWTSGLLQKLRSIGIQGNMYKWTKSYLYNRKARVKVDNSTSRKVPLRHGVPQGGVMSPSLFIIFINDLVKELPHGIRTALYADDLVMWCSEEHATTATLRMQKAADILMEWTKKWQVTVNIDKSSTTFFTLSNKQRTGTIKLTGLALKEDAEPTYLGITFDKKLTWKQHLQKAENKARRKLAIMRKLSGTTWGASEKTLKNVYQQGVRPHLEYGAPAWTSASNSTLQPLDKVQNQALRIITGGMRSTPIATMEKMTGIEPLKERRDTKIMLQAEKFTCTPGHPVKGKLEDLAKGRLKRSSFIHQAKRLRRQHLRELPMTVAEISSIPESTPWKESTQKLIIRTTVEGVYAGELQNDLQRRTATLSALDNTYPSDQWTRVYTDGSAENAVRKGGAGIHIEHPDGSSEDRSIPTGEYCSNYSAETNAIVEATRMLQEVETEDTDIVFLTDAQSVLEALQSGKLQEANTALKQLGRARKIVLQWIPSHCGIPGNEKADRLAKEGSASEQPNQLISYREKRRLIKEVRRKSPEVRDDYHSLSRQQQVIITRLRTGHNRLKAHMYKKFKIGTGQCNCGAPQQDAEHILQHCKLFKDSRDKHWPVEADLNTKLHGPLDELIKTTAFIIETGLSV